MSELLLTFVSFKFELESFWRCGKLLKDADAATAHAVRTNHSSFSECTEQIKPLTAEEREEMKKKFVCEQFNKSITLFCFVDYKNVLLLVVKNNS